MVESTIKVYVSSLSGNKEVKKRQQRVMMILESKNIKYTAVDITEPGLTEEKDFMQANATEKGITVSDTDPRHPLPPQIFNGTEYCGDYNSFELANECDTLEQFLKLEVQKNGSSASVPTTPAPAAEVPADTTPATETNGTKNGDVEETEAPAVPVETTNEDAEEVNNDTPADDDAAPPVATETSDAGDGGDSGAAGDSGAGDASTD